MQVFFVVRHAKFEYREVQTKKIFLTFFSVHGKTSNNCQMFSQ